ncbi:MAG: hypothetical protein HY685_04715 [Chloroflexi bacterium]|nr:hypothetical protein [Chloroflexota bacterium]
MPLVFGVLCGWLMGGSFVGLMSLMLPRLARERPGLLRQISRETTPLQIVIPAFGLAFLGWGVVGLVLGAVYLLLEDTVPGGGLGSPNQAFTLFVLGLAAAGAIPLGTLWRWGRLPVLGIVVSFLLLFGWVFPWLAS